MGTSIRKIAELAGVSPAAVSHALRGSPKVSAATRLKIERIAAKLGYQRDWQTARIMGRFRSAGRPGSAGTLAVINPSGSMQTVPPESSINALLPAIKARAQELNFAVDTFGLDQATVDASRLRRIFYTRGIQGGIVLNAATHLDRLPFENDGFPTVAIGYSITQPLHRVCPDQYGDMLMVLHKLWELGYRRPALLIYPDLDQRTDYRFSAAYLAFYERILEESPPAIYAGARHPLRLRRWLTQARPDVLIFEEQYYYPKWIIEQAAGVGLQVPSNVALVSFDVAPHADIPPLAGLSQNWPELGRRAAESIIGKIYQGPAASLAGDSPGIVELVRSKWIPGWSAPKRG